MHNAQVMLRACVVSSPTLQTRGNDLELPLSNLLVGKLADMFMTAYVAFTACMAVQVMVATLYRGKQQQTRSALHIYTLSVSMRTKIKQCCASA